MNPSDLKIQHQILMLLNKQSDDFYLHDKSVDPALKIDAIIDKIGRSEEKVKELLTNLCTRNLITKSNGNRWEYVIVDDGISAFLEKRLLSESKEKVQSIRKVIFNLFATIISIIIGIVSAGSALYSGSEIQKLQEENVKLEKRIKTLEESKLKDSKYHIK